MWNLRNKAEDHGVREEKVKWDETREGDKPQETLNLRKQTEGCWRGGGCKGWGNWVMGLK